MDVARRRLSGEDHAADLRVDHPLDDDGDLDVVGGEVARGAIRQRSFGERRRPHALHGVAHRIETPDVQKAFVNPRE